MLKEVYKDEAITSKSVYEWFKRLHRLLKRPRILPHPQIEVIPEGKEIYGHQRHSKQRDGRAESHAERTVLQEFPGLIYTRSQQCITTHGDYFEGE
ncbi:hypothetical protein TNCV_3234381 [Trichonephila clavipes]|nr:hypothetical protein TNCV_3234381 [Trichonephila clavipes]